jgi:hypothetical protein
LGGLRVFVLGSERSGTSITAACLRRVYGLAGRGESHVVTAFVEMLETLSRHKARKSRRPNLLVNQLDPALVEAKLAEAISAFYAGAFPRGRFVDKTPGVAVAEQARLILKAFPDARVVVTRRTGVEVVDSYARKFEVSIEAASRAWAAAAESIAEVEADVAGALVVEHFDLTNDADAVGAALSAHMGEGDRAAEIAQFFRTQELQATSTASRLSRRTLAEVDWAAADKAAFTAVCGPMMARFGYPF